MRNVLILIAILIIGCQPKEEKTSSEPPAIVPQPSSVSMKSGKYELPESVSIKTNATEANETSTFLIDFLKSQEISVATDADSQPIQLDLSDKANIPAEGYLLSINENGINIEASTRTGLFYGVQSLIQLMATNNKALPYLEISDAPRFAYRGMHLDVARHMFPVEFVKKYIDMMSHFKFNTFHWHLTEDQGWRIEIKQYPELQTKAAYRDETVIGYATTSMRDSVKYDGQPYGGYYTQDEVREVVEYAAKRNITVIPEIELPGHSQAALTAYPHLGCTGGPYKTATSWGVFNEIYCAGKESTFEFLKNVFDEVLPLFPGKYVHIGGDEAPKTRWEKCPHCQKRIQDEELADEHELQSYFVQRIEKYLNEKGKTIIGWDEILEGGLAPNAVVMSWRGEEGGIEAAQQNHQVIMTPHDRVYFDYYQADPASEPTAIKHVTTVETAYGYEPVPQELTTEQAKLVLGAQCNLWSEYIPSGDHAEYMVYPRALAMSEVLWSPKASKDYEQFVNRVTKLRPLLDHWNINYAKHIFQDK